MADYIYSMETRLTPDQQRGVNLVQEIAQRAGLNLYLTGGTIRDLVTGFPIRDVDLSIQGNPLKLQRELEKADISVQGLDEDLRTLHLLMPGNVRAELNMTRAESHGRRERNHGENACEGAEQNGMGRTCDGIHATHDRAFGDGYQHDTVNSCSDGIDGA